jgi:pimeloyl-ACP methyl ester carboxylesterase
VLDDKTVTVPGGLAQQVFTGGSGRPVVWLHGLGGVKPDDAFFDLLAKSHSVVAPIQPGHNNLAELNNIDDIHDLVLQYDSLFEAMGLDRFTLAGHGFGGMLAAEIAAYYPKRIAKLALIAPLGLWNEAYPVADLFARPYAQMDEFLWQGAVDRPKPTGAAAPIDPAEQNIIWVNSAGSIAKFVWPIPDRGLRKRLHRISAPTLLVFGDHDAYVPASYAKDFAERISGARTVTMKGSHMLPFEHPEQVTSAIGLL